MVTGARLAAEGFAVLPADPRVAAWADAARRKACDVLADPEARSQWLRHGGTWFVGVDALPNAPDGSVDGVPLAGPWEGLIAWPAALHRAQVSAVYPGYPQQDSGESDANHRFRRTRDAAHLDGLLAEGPDRRRHLREPHAFILGLPLTEAAPGAAPLVVWEGSHRIMGAALRARLEGVRPEDWAMEDLTDAYSEARRRVFEDCPRRALPLLPGQSVLVHRLAIHGVAPWAEGAWAAPEGRVIAYFRPLLAEIADWLAD